MSRREDRTAFRQMLDHIEEAVALARKHKRRELESDRVLFLALVKLVEIVGEAAGRVSRTSQAEHPEIPWREIIGTRNRLTHGYDAVDCDILWEILTADFPAVADLIRPIIAAEE
jgi:uncharacterized protein with HEPN domain